MSRSRVDLRSDTVTQPTDEMRQAMATAVLGDDGYGEDPTVVELEETYARLVGKEAALLVPSGVMANQLALRCLTNPGEVIVAGRHQHVVAYELGAAGLNAGVQILGIDDTTGALDRDELAEAIAGVEHHQPAITAVFAENSHMASGGRVAGPGVIEEIARVTNGLPIHLDGARLFNAAVASGRTVGDLASGATTVMSCLSKGLSCPVGSLLAGSTSLIEHARVERKRLGGSMRQAGIIAACGLVALRSMIERLADDHRRADELRRAVSGRWPDVAPSLEGQSTNLVVFEHPDTLRLVGHLEHLGIASGTIGPGMVRLVTHRGIDDSAIERTVAAIRSAP
jgi:threonine aldolase